MENIKVFSSAIETVLAEKVNDWVRGQGSMCVVDEWHFSSAFDTSTSSVVYSVMIVYREL